MITVLIFWWMVWRMFFNVCWHRHACSVLYGTLHRPTTAAYSDLFFFAITSRWILHRESSSVSDLSFQLLNTGMFQRRNVSSTTVNTYPRGCQERTLYNLCFKSLKRGESTSGEARLFNTTVTGLYMSTTSRWGGIVTFSPWLIKSCCFEGWGGWNVRIQN